MTTLTAVRRALLGLLILLIAPAVADAKVKTFTLRSEAYELGRFETEFVKDEVPTPALKGHVTDMHARLVDAKGRQVTVKKAMLHHIFFNNLGRKRVAGNCTSRKPEVFYGTGEEDQSLDLPAGYGYRLKRGDKWLMSAMLMSHEHAKDTVYVEYTVTVDDGPLTGVRPLWVRANGCGSQSSYHVRGGGGEGSVKDTVHHWKVPLTGRIVAAGGHLHAGSLDMQLRDPACGDRVLFHNRPSYAPADDLLYTNEPFLHEAGPTQTSWFSSRTGIPVAKGQVLDLHGYYENAHARQSVMAITHIYVAPERRVPAGCVPLPADARQSVPRPGQRSYAPYQPIPLYKLDAQRRPVRMAEPEGTVVPLADGATIALKAYRFQPSEKVTIKAGSTINWSFQDTAAHNLTLASGPRAVAGQTLGKGATASTRFETPGRYQLFCYLHPMTMREQIDVLP